MKFENVYEIIVFEPSNRLCQDGTEMNTEQQIQNTFGYFND